MICNIVDIDEYITEILSLQTGFQFFPIPKTLGKKDIYIYYYDFINYNTQLKTINNYINIVLALILLFTIIFTIADFKYMIAILY